MDASRIELGSELVYPAGSQMRADIEAHAASGEPPVEPKLAATVLLARPARDPKDVCELFMMLRAKTMAFVPDAVVFPGGSAKKGPVSGDVAWSGPSPAEWGKRTGLSEEDAYRVVLAAVRELFEESGVLLASVGGEGVPDTSEGSHLLGCRAAIEAHELDFEEFLKTERLTVRADHLGLRSRWITPEFHPRRYDTFFFAARLPQGQQAHGLTTESVKAGWMTPREVLAAADAGRLKVMPPTVCNLALCMREPDLDRFLRGRNSVGVTMSAPVSDGRGGYEMRCVLR